MLSLQTRAVLDIVMKYIKPEVSNRAGRMPNGLGHIRGVIFLSIPGGKGSYSSDRMLASSSEGSTAFSIGQAAPARASTASLS